MDHLPTTVRRQLRRTVLVLSALVALMGALLLFTGSDADAKSTKVEVKIEQSRVDTRGDDATDVFAVAEVDDGFGLKAPTNGATAASSANCWPDGTGCGPGGQIQFETNCDSSGGGLSTHDDGEGGSYVKCTLPPH